MKVQFALVSLFSAAMAAPGLAAPGDGPKGWNILNFSAVCTPRSSCQYSFDVEAFGKLAAHCSATAAPEGTTTLPAISQRECDDIKAFTWSVSKLPDGGLSLTIDQKVNLLTHINGHRDMDASQFKIVFNGAAGGQKYIGPENFTFPTKFVEN